MNRRSVISVLWVFLSAAPLLAKPPALDQSRIVWMHEPWTDIIPLRDGKIGRDIRFQCHHQQCQKRYDSLKLPIPMVRLRQYEEKDVYLGGKDEFQGIDDAGRQWYWGVPHGAPVAWYIQNGQLARQELGSAIKPEYAPASYWPWRGGHVLCDKDGRVWVLGVDALYQFHDGKFTAITFPTLSDPAARRAFKFDEEFEPRSDETLYGIGRDIWIVRQCISYDWSGSFLIRCSDQTATVMALPKQHIVDLVHHKGNLYLLMNQYGHDDWPGILRLPSQGGNVLTSDEFEARIADLDSPKFKVRQQTTESLKHLSPSHIKDIKDALNDSTSIEQRRRLQEILNNLLENSLGKPEKAELCGLSTGRLLLIDREGRQYVKGDDRKTNRRLLVLDGKTSREITLPSARFSLDCQGDDGRLYGHDRKSLYALDPNTLKLTTLAHWGTIDPEPIVATHKGLICVKVNVSSLRSEAWQGRATWFDLSAPAESPRLTGREISGWLYWTISNESLTYPVVMGPDGRLWFVRQRSGKHENPERTVLLTQLCRVDGDKVQEVTEWLPFGIHPNIWVLDGNAAIVSAMDLPGSYEGVSAFLYIDGQTHQSRNLMTLVEEQYSTLRERMPDGSIFMAGRANDLFQLMRLGDTFYVEGRIRKGAGNRTILRSCGLFRDGAWAEKREKEISLNDDESDYRPIFSRLFATDPSTGRALGMIGDRKELQWIKVSSTGKDTEVLAVKPASWGWSRWDCAHLPRKTSWLLTPAAADHLLAVYPQREAQCRRRGSSDIEHLDSDFPAMQRWVDGRFRVLHQTLSGSAPWDLDDAGLWLTRTREVEVVFPDGRRQLMPLDATTLNATHVVRESDTAVWVTTLQSLWRFRLEKGADGKQWWQADRRYRLPQLDKPFGGPWITNGHLYYTLTGRLYHTALPDLLAKARSLPAGPVKKLSPLELAKPAPAE